MEDHENISPPSTSNEYPTGSLGLKWDVDKDQRAEALHPMRHSLANPSPPLSPGVHFNTLPRTNASSPTSPIDPTSPSKESKSRRSRLFFWLNSTGNTPQSPELGSASDMPGEVTSPSYSTVATTLPTSRSIRSMDVRHLDPSSYSSSSLGRSAPSSNRSYLPPTPQPVDMPEPRPRLALGADLTTSVRPLSTTSLPVNTFQPTMASDTSQAPAEQRNSTHLLLQANSEHRPLSRAAAIIRPHSGGPSSDSLSRETQHLMTRQPNPSQSVESTVADTGINRHSMVSPLARYSFSLQGAEMSDIDDQASETGIAVPPSSLQQVSTSTPHPVPLYEGRSSPHTVTPRSTRESLVSPLSDSSAWDTASVRSRNTIPPHQSKISIKSDTSVDSSIRELSKRRLKQATRQLQELAGKSLAYVRSTGNTTAEASQDYSRPHSLDDVPVSSDQSSMGILEPGSQPDLRVGMQRGPEPFIGDDDVPLRYYDQKSFPIAKGAASSTSDQSSPYGLGTSQPQRRASSIKPRLSISTSVSAEPPGSHPVRVSSVSSTDSNRVLDTLSAPISPTLSSPRSLYYRGIPPGTSSPVSVPGPLSHHLPTDASSSFNKSPTLATLSEMSAQIDPVADERLFSTPIPKPFAQIERVQECSANQPSTYTTSTDGTLGYPPSSSTPVSPRSVHSQSSHSTGNRSAYTLHSGEGLTPTSVSEVFPPGPPVSTASQELSSMDDDSPLALALALLADGACRLSFFPPRPERLVDTENRQGILSSNRRAPLFIVQPGYARDKADCFANSTHQNLDSRQFLATATQALHRAPNLSVMYHDVSSLEQDREPRVTCDQLLREASLACELQDYPKATLLYRDSALHGSFHGLFLYGLALWAGWGCTADPPFALQCLEAAVGYAAVEISIRLTETVYPAPFKRHLTLALYELALCHRYGWGTPVDLVQAAYYLKITAQLGDPDAQEDLAFCYLDGQGVTRDMSSAMSYFSQADRQGIWLYGNMWCFKRKYLMQYSWVT
ncbi:hypothetical protein IWQ62_004752 [Dispira parvispora]|uniref:Uncharacterized protein n=1 Tax=Dispira parvispora TaxID=1520584 RepID=A0A9W8E1P3_9FUNG|nr:hypothetical protein IWQ62_004752 [Dispira parvispora]